MKKKRLFINAVLTLPLLLTSCANYCASPLCNLSPDLVLTVPKEEGISVVSKAFTQNDCERFLDRNVLAEGYQPVQIYIENDSEKNYSFSLNRISLPVARPEEVAEKVHTSTVGRAVGYGVGALLLWPLAIPAIVDGIKSSQANAALDSDFAAKAARDQVIFPHSRFNAIIFVPSDAYQNTYTLTLMDLDTQEPKLFNLVSN